MTEALQTIIDPQTGTVFAYLDETTNLWREPNSGAYFSPSGSGQLASQEELDNHVGQLLEAREMEAAMAAGYNSAEAERAALEARQAAEVERYMAERDQFLASDERYKGIDPETFDRFVAEQPEETGTWEGAAAAYQRHARDPLSAEIDAIWGGERNNE